MLNSVAGFVVSREFCPDEFIFYTLKYDVILTAIYMVTKRAVPMNSTDLRARLHETRSEFKPV